MNIILVPGLTASIDTLHFLRNRLEAEGHVCYGPGFNWNTMLNGELGNLLDKIDGIEGPVALIGHSAGGLLSIVASQRRDKVLGVIGLGSAVVGDFSDLTCPYYEARSLWGLLFPLTGVEEVKVFPVGHSMLPFMSCVQNWVVARLEEISARSR